MSAFMRSWGQICDNRGSIGATLSLIWAALVPTSAILGSSGVYLRPSCHPLGSSLSLIGASLAQLQFLTLVIFLQKPATPSSFALALEIALALSETNKS